MEVADAVDWDEYVAVGSGGIVGRAIVNPLSPDGTRRFPV